MSNPTTVAEIDLSPLPGKTYYDTAREWREEFIYFLLVDRFHDGTDRTPTNSTGRAAGGGTFNQLGGVCGGNLKGITRHLDYIAGLGCTAIWLSPIFENNSQDAGSYHGYAIENYLDVDPRFGTKQDLIDLVDAAHALDMRVFLDVVINHSGDLWRYDAADNAYRYVDAQQFPLHSFRRADRPVPTELRDARFFHRRGQIQNYDAFPEFELGDFDRLKDWAHGTTADASELMEILVAVHAHWIRETDVDGFRMDAVKHLGPVASARFATAVREYAYGLGKRSFMTFGELIAGDDSINRFIGPNTAVVNGHDGLFFGIDSVLDFPLYFVLPDVIKGLKPPGAVFNRYDAMRDRALNRGELGQFLVTFLDNHDGLGPDPKHRFASGAPDEQVIAGVGFLLCSLGIACLYYGTEQGLSGTGNNDRLIRETLFDMADPARDFLNPQCRIYREIANIAAVHRTIPALRFGRMYMREISGNGRDFGRPIAHPCTLAFSRMLAGQEVVVAYNTSTTQARADFVCVDARLQRDGGDFTFIYGGAGTVPVQKHPDPNNGTRSLQIPLQPMQFVILVRG